MNRDQVRAVLEERRAQHAEQEHALSKRSRVVSWTRLVVFVAIVATGLLSYDLGAGLGYALLWSCAPLLIFVALLVFHDRLENELRDRRARAAFYASSLLRTQDERAWTGRGDPGAPPSEEHAFALDLDLFGEGSLFELLCRCATPWGSARLSSWLLAPATIDEVTARQLEVKRLATDLEKREALAAAAARSDLHRKDGDPREGFADASALTTWAESEARFSPIFVGLLYFNVVVTCVLTTMWALGLLFYGAPILSFLVSVGVARLIARPTSEALNGPQKAELSLEPLARLLEVSELPEAAKAVKKLASYQRQAAQIRNPFFLPFALALGWREFFALLTSRWRKKYRAELPEWISAIAELEALASLAAFQYEQGGVFPTFDNGRAHIDIEQLAHPLLEDHGIANDVHLDASRALLLVSGSNMSGKSTFMRSLGTAVVLAGAGAPVLARACSLSPLSLAASIASSDSIQSGASRFYAELLRLKQVKESAERGPTLYLLDELLSGTNSHDRKLGASALLKRLLEVGALGVVTTHDLALTEIDDERVVNVHFRDTLKDGELHFDYRLKDGVVAHSNAQALMQEVGLL